MYKKDKKTTTSFTVLYFLTRFVDRSTARALKICVNVLKKIICLNIKESIINLPSVPRDFTLLLSSKCLNMWKSGTEKQRQSDPKHKAQPSMINAPTIAKAKSISNVYSVLREG